MFHRFHILHGIGVACLLAAFLLSARMGRAAAKPDTLRVDIHYLQGRSEFIDSLRSNAAAIDSLRSVASRGRVQSISIVSGASPDGAIQFNQSLSEDRSETAAALLKGLFPDADIYVRSIGIDWQGMVRLMAHQQPPSAECYWRWIYESIFPDLRVSHISVVHDRWPDRRKTAIPQMPALSEYDISLAGPMAILSDKPATQKSFYFGVRTNLLYDAVAIPNIGVIAGLGQGWALGIDGYYADWSHRSHSRFWRVQGAKLSVRKLINNRKSYTGGWFIEAYSQLFRYNICSGGTGYMSGYSGARFFKHPTWGVGLAAGYSLALSKHLSIDFAIGAGYLTGQYQTYRLKDNHLVWQSTRQRNYFGPTEAAAGLVWHFGKGGSR